MPGIGATIRSGPCAARPPRAHGDSNPLAPHVDDALGAGRLRFDDHVVHRAVGEAQAEAAEAEITNVAGRQRLVERQIEGPGVASGPDRHLPDVTGVFEVEA